MRRCPGAVASEQKFLMVTAGHDHACALTVDRQLMCWGSNLQGQLGTEVRLRSFAPVHVVVRP